MLTKALSVALDAVLPPRCPACGVVVGGDHSFCASCFGQLRLLAPPWCNTCGEPFELGWARGAICERCAAAPPTFDAARAPLVYEDPARALVLRLKHGDMTALAPTMALQMLRVASEWLIPDSLIVPVPLHRWRLWRRGYNQAALIASALSRRAGVPTSLDALVRTRATRPSGGMTREERLANVEGAFAVRRPAEIAGRPIILVDDVLTSGATMNACAAALKGVGSGPVRALAFARVARTVRPAHIGEEGAAIDDGQD